jgi:hypothetical protein
MLALAGPFSIVKGLVRGQAIATTSLGEEDGLYRTTDVVRKAQAGLTPTSTSNREEDEKGGPCCLSELGCLATYIGHVTDDPGFLQPVRP